MSLAQRGRFDAKEIVYRYEDWVRKDSYVVMSHLKEGWIDPEEPTEYIGVKCAKRGNDVYLLRVEGRLRGLSDFVDDMKFDFEKHPYAKALSVTLTYDTKLCSFDVAWKNIGIEFNRFKANIRKKYGAFSAFRTWESFENGHPHIHAILVFQEYEFKVFKSYEGGEDGELKEVWLVDEKKDWEKYWHSWIKVKAVYSLFGGLNYLKKYIMKCAKYNTENRKGVLTLAMCWVFRKKAFYVSGEFRKALSDLIRSICSSKTRKVQVDLSGNELEANSWKVLGFISLSFLDSIGIDDLEKWTISLTSKQVAEIYGEWEKFRHYQ